MHYILILSLYHGGITVIPNTYTLADCTTSGEAWKKQIGNDFNAYGSYICLLKTD